MIDRAHTVVFVEKLISMFLTMPVEREKGSIVLRGYGEPHVLLEYCRSSTFYFIDSGLTASLGTTGFPLNTSDGNTITTLATG